MADSPGTKYYLNGITDEHARAFHTHYELEIEEGVFIRGVLAMRHRTQLEHMLKSDDWQGIEVADQKFTPLEFKVIKRNWTRERWDTLRHLSRLHRILIVACIFAAMTQGWDQAAMAGMFLSESEIDGRETLTKTRGCYRSYERIGQAYCG
jgi:hypothetical protein